jgi:hypothetical protein
MRTPRAVTVSAYTYAVEPAVWDGPLAQSFHDQTWPETKSRWTVERSPVEIVDRVEVGHEPTTTRQSTAMGSSAGLPCTARMRSSSAQLTESGRGRCTVVRRPRHTEALRTGAGTMCACWL